VEKVQTFRVVDPAKKANDTMLFTPAAMGLSAAGNCLIEVFKGRVWTYWAMMTAVCLHYIVRHLVYRRRMRDARVEATAKGMTLVVDGLDWWRVDWSSIDSVVLRRTGLPVRMEVGQYILTLKDGTRRAIPALSTIFGPMADAGAFEARLAEEGFELGQSHYPRWITPEGKFDFRSPQPRIGVGE